MAKEEIKFCIGGAGGIPGKTVAESAALAERLGFDGLVFGGGIIGYGGHDPFILMAQAAAVTERLLFSTSVYLLPFNHPLVLAKQLATLDHLSKGRVIFGVGTGERARLHDIYGFPMSERGARTDEYIEILKGVWTQSPYRYQGKFFRFGEMPQEPTYQKPHIPIWVGGRVGGVEFGPDGKRRFKSRTAAIRRAARYGDGWLPYFTVPEEYKATVQMVKDSAREYGRENHPMTWAFHCFMVVKDSYDEALESATKHQTFGGGSPEFSRRFDFIGTPQDCIKRLQEYVDVGVRHFNIQRPLVAPEEFPHQLERIAKEVLPAFR
ncbi:MAG: LLM class flavin-dependent oxidoreductase [Chloroflexi bacterium]|nr:LLM class flavin-dependent oxidoreductase [Chloroflexota bacterium]